MSFFEGGGGGYIEDLLACCQLSVHRAKRQGSLLRQRFYGVGVAEYLVESSIWYKYNHTSRFTNLTFAILGMSNQVEVLGTRWRDYLLADLGSPWDSPGGAGGSDW